MRKVENSLSFLQEKLFVDSQDRRRNTQTAINDVQGKLKSIRSELERTARGDDKYLALVTEEHSIIKEEFSLASQLENVFVRPIQLSVFIFFVLDFRFIYQYKATDLRTM